MYTQEELRAALAHSASRADDLLELDAVHSAAGVAITPAEAQRPRLPRRRRVLPALAAAVAVAAVAAGTVGMRTWIGEPDSRSSAALPGASTSAPSTSADGSATTAPPRRIDTDALTDVVSLLPDAQLSARYHLMRGVEEVSQPTGTGPNDPVLTIDVVGPAAGLDPGRIPRDRPITIGGITGYYSNLRIFPIDGSTSPGSDKWLPAWTIAFSQGDNWVFVWLQTTVDTAAKTNSLDDPQRIAQVYEQHEATFGTSIATLPFRIGWLPDGTTLEAITLSRAAGSGATLVNGVGITLATIGGGSIYINAQGILPMSSPHCSTSTTAPSASDNPLSEGCSPEPISLDLSPYGFLVVSGSSVDTATQQRILDSITLADLSEPTSFYTLAEALG